MLTRSKAAFCFSAERLRQPGERLYFWTFTFVELHADWICAKLWSDFLREMRQSLDSDVSGVRVAELHKDHGVHFHAIFNRRLSISLVKRIARRFGFGRIQVTRVRPGEWQDTVLYLAKYLTKQREGPLCESGRAMRRWAAFGPVKHCCVKDVVNDSDYWLYRRAGGFGWQGYAAERTLAAAWVRGEEHFEWCYSLIRQGDLEQAVTVALGTGVECRRNRAGCVVPILRPQLVSQPF